MICMMIINNYEAEARAPRANTVCACAAVSQAVSGGARNVNDLGYVDASIPVGKKLIHARLRAIYLSSK